MDASVKHAGDRDTIAAEAIALEDLTALSWKPPAAGEPLLAFAAEDS
jgi:hypothetical protein